MTAAVAGAGRAAAGGGRAAASGAAARRPRKPLSPEAQKYQSEVRTERANARRGRRDADKFQRDYGDGSAAEKPTAGGDDSPSSSTSSSTRSTPQVNVSMPGAVSSGAGFILAVLFWSWVALPFLKGGPEGVKNVLKAKFLNKAPDGSWLP